MENKFELSSVSGSIKFSTHHHISRTKARIDIWIDSNLTVLRLKRNVSKWAISPFNDSVLVQRGEYDFTCQIDYNTERLYYNF
jgi:hypothetical protein